MADWKKVIVSGSSAELHHVTASGGVSTNVMFGQLPEASDSNVLLVGIDLATGLLSFKTQSQFPGFGGG
jgi:hypothetical protein